MPLDRSRVPGHSQALCPFASTLENLGAPQDLQPCLAGIIDHNGGSAIVTAKIAGRNRLLVPAIIGESDRSIVDNLEEPLRPTVMCTYGHPVAPTVAI